ncbi:MAG: hypothetical protein Q9225_002266 [Loekoesia sp. 1 TL-2023]
MSSTSTPSPIENSQDIAQSRTLSHTAGSNTQKQEQQRSFPSEIGALVSQDRTELPWPTQAFLADSADIFSPHAVQSVLGNFDTQHHGRLDYAATSLQLDNSGVANDSSFMVDQGSRSLSHTLGPFLSPGNLPVSAQSMAPSRLEGHSTLAYDMDSRPGPSHEAESAPSGLLNEAIFPKKGKTVITVENLDSETRAEILDLLFKRKLVTTVEVI